MHCKMCFYSSALQRIERTIKHEKIRIFSKSYSLFYLTKNLSESYNLTAQLKCNYYFIIVIIINLIIYYQVSDSL